ncbi:hypothetical protein DRO48_02835 [Candidatus Bathyarchaeota archaeon]|nr:MAG: hypothetical protein DRO48_02835 [Candidatus Bathyarchaeota archaeon]
MIREKVRSGIEGLDELIEGGFPKGRTVLVAGETGTGKTTFSIQYLYNGAVCYGENGVFVTIDERHEFRVEDAASIGWDLEALIDENKLLMVEITPLFSTVKGIDAKKIVENIAMYVKEVNATRLVLDPVAPLITPGEEPIDPLSMQAYVRNYLRKLFFSLTELGVTTVATSEIPTGTSKLSRYGIEEFLASGIIVLRLRRDEGRFHREIYIRKMRGVNHSMDVYSFIIEHGRGIVISI